MISRNPHYMLHRVWSIFSLFGLGALLWSTACWADTLVISASDMHSQYDRMPEFVSSISKLKQEFFEAHPDGKCLMVFNGDLGGVSEWAVDKGELVYRVLALLSKGCEVVLTLGNHEALDFRSNQLFLEQNNLFRRIVSQNQVKPQYVTTANVEPSAETQDLFRPFYDFKLPHSERIRVIGLTLDRFLSTTVYDFEQRPQLWSGFKDSLETAWEQVQLAHTQGIGKIIIAIHDDHTEASKLLREIKRRVKAQGWQIDFPLLISGHDHAELYEVEDGTTHIDPRCQFDFYALRLSDSGAVRQVKSFGKNAQENYYSPSWKGFTSEEQIAMAEIQRVLLLVKEENDSVVGSTPGTSESKHDLRGARGIVGAAIADTHRYWVESKMVQATQAVNAEAVFAFFNTRSYRRETPIPSGDLTMGVLKSIYLLPTESRAFAFDGKTIQALYRALRDKEAAEGVVNPQLSSNLRTRDGKLEVNLVGQSWHGLKDDAIYVLALDGWLAQNGYKIPAWDELLSRGLPVSEKVLTSDIIQEFAPRTLSFPCMEEIARAGIQW